MDSDRYLGSEDPEFESALLDFDVDAATASSNNIPATASSSNIKRSREDDNLPIIPIALGGKTGDYRDGDQYQPVGFGEFGTYMHNKRKKLQVQNSSKLEGGETRLQLFKGLRIYINGYTESIGLGELRDLLILHGGTYVPYLDQKGLVTHIIATNLTPSKRKEFASYKVATPDWLVDSVKEGKLLDWRKYSLLAPPKSTAPLRKAGFEEEVDRMGAETGQQSLFSMGLGKGPADKGKGKAKEPALARSPSKQHEKANIQTRESLAERGVRLAEAAIAEQQQVKLAAAPSFFQPRSGSSRLTTPVSPARPAPRSGKSSGPTTPTRLPSNLPATTDSPHAPTETSRSWLPQKKRDERTTALLNDPEWLAKHTSASEDFLEGYFAQSRLHHLSTFKEALKLLVASRQSGTTPLRKKRLTGTAADGRTIFHVDFDCFFVSAGLTKRPELRGKPVAVCHARGTGDGLSSTSEIASCSYEARAFGIKNGMSLGRARELCPDILTMPFEFEMYKDFSLKFYNILLAHAHFLQAVSMDEALLEVEVCPTLSSDSDPALDLAHRIRAEIFEATGCPASIGISHNITLARLATRKAKPASAYHLLHDEVPDFLAPLDVDSLPGIGYNLRHKLRSELGVATVGDLLKIRPSELARVIGSQNGQKFGAFAKGIDDRELEAGKPRKSVSAEVNYGIRFEQGRDDQVERFLRALGEETAKRLRHEGLKARQLTLKVMTRHPEAPVDTPKLLGHGWVITENKNSNVAGAGGSATDNGEIIGETAWKLMRAMNAPAHELRGIGIQLQKLEKDGRPVDVVREKGQATLSFGAAPKPAPTRQSSPQASSSRNPRPLSPTLIDLSSSQPQQARPPTVTVSSSPKEQHPPLARQQSLAPPPPKQAHASKPDQDVLVLDDSDTGDDATPPVPAVSRTRSRSTRSISRKSDPYIPNMFRSSKKNAAPPPPTASQVSDADLEYYGIDPEFYHALDRQSRMEVLADVRRTRPPPTPSKRKKTAPTPPPPPAAGGSSAAFTSAPPPPMVIVLPPSPTDINDGALASMDIPRDVWAVLGKATQLEHLDHHKARQSRLVVGDRHKRDGQTASRSTAAIREVSIRPEPRFKRLTDVNDIRDKIEQWVGGGTHALCNDDLDSFARYLERCVSREHGHDSRKAVELLQWWAYLLQDEFGKREDAEGRARAWWEGYERTVERVEYLVQKETGCRLVL
ncbi:hypothetical protein JCM1841_002930 [Sporobolomyces salmonicolor]